MEDLDSNMQLSCGYCNHYLGTLDELMSTNVLNHPCLETFANVTIDAAARKVWGVNTPNSQLRPHHVHFGNVTDPREGCSKSKLTSESDDILNSSAEYTKQILNTPNSQLLRHLRPQYDNFGNVTDPREECSKLTSDSNDIRTSSAEYTKQILNTPNSHLLRQLRPQHDTFGNVTDPREGCSKLTSEFDDIQNCSAEYTEQISSPRCSSESSPRCSKEIWSYETTKLLIVSYNENKHKFESPQYNKKGVWESISQKMKEKGIHRPGEKCCEKWRNLKKTYEKILKEKNTTGNSNVHWIFYDDFHEIYFKDPHFNPVYTVNSSGASKKRVFENTSPEQGFESLQEEVNNKKSKCFTKKDGEQLTLTEIENKRQKRHEEKLAQKQEIFEWFKENFKKD